MKTLFLIFTAVSILIGTSYALNVVTANQIKTGEPFLTREEICADADEGTDLFYVCHPDLFSQDENGDFMNVKK